MLNKHQTTLTKRNQEVKKVLAENQKDVDSYAPFKNKVTEFYDNTAIVDDELPDKDVTGTGATESKDITKETVAETTANICNLARPYAMEVGNKDLLAGISYSYSDVLGIRDTSLLGSVTAVSNLLMPLVDDDIFKTYLVTKQMLNDMVNGASDFNAMLGDSQLITNGSRVANKNINSALSAANQNIAQLNLLITHFQKSNPDFVKAYQNAVRINNSGVQRSGVEGVITSAATGKPISGAKIMLEDTTKEATSSLTGNYSIIKVLSKEFNMIVSAPGFETKEMVIKIIRGKVIKLDIAL